ncbi:MAG: hypothetical protein JO287_07370 [Pseudonocardiales bacterium]|nr:hypothetical protein [Pseudonocardiales bacterium]
MVHPPGDDTEDAARWWRAYQLAQNDQVGELRKLAAAGDQHARRQLASWLSDRGWCGDPWSDKGKMAEAIEVIRPVADAGDDVAEMWLARWLADCDRLDELRERADSGGYYAVRELARRLGERDMLDELRERANRGDDHALRELARGLAAHNMREELRELVDAADADRQPMILRAAGSAGSAGIDVLRMVADLGDDSARRWLVRRLAREGRLDELRDRAEDGDYYARQWLADERA